VTITIVRRWISDDCRHDYPDDWTFGGANGGDPRADSRWQPTLYEYMNRSLATVHVSTTPLCDHEAIHQEKPQVDTFKGSEIFYIRATRPDGTTEIIYEDIEGAWGGSAS